MLLARLQLRGRRTAACCPDPDADLTTPPPASRYDILTQESRLLLPSVAASYRVLPELDVGVRFTAGSVESKSQVAVWGTPFNVAESIRNDSLFTAEVKDGSFPGPEHTF